MNAPVRSIADLDPSTLSQKQRRALRTVKAYKCFRRAGGYGRTPNSVSLDVANSMIALGLLRRDLAGHTPELVLTGAGLTIHGIMEQRIAQRRKA
jgi:hypothetical protein